jgi:polysaccharide export outer membrane protein
MPVEIPTRAPLHILPKLRALGVAIGALALCGCSDISSMTRHALGRDKVSPEVAAVREDSLNAGPGAYLIGPEDVLDISVWKEDALKKESLVRPDGGISFPLVGDLQASGKTTEEVRLEITDRLKKYIADPVVSVSILKASNYKIYVIGRVNKPGDFTSGRAIDVLQALSMAGGLTPFASDSDIHVVRKLAGRELNIPFDYNNIQRGEHLDQNIILKSGDVVVVP